MKLRPFTAALSLSFAAALAAPVFAADSAKPGSAGYPASADDILREMSGRLARAQRLSFQAHREISPALLPGRTVPEKTRIDVLVLRPNKVAAKSSSPGDVRLFYADGRTATLLDVTKNHYATVPLRASLDGLAAQLGAQYGFTPPLAEFVRSDMYGDIRHQAQSITDLGRGYLPGGFLGLGGTECRRVALSGKVVDTEVWVALSDLLPRRLTATFKDHAGRPQIKVEFSDWNLAAKATDQDFAFTPPKGALKIPMLTTAEMDAARKKVALKKK